MFRKEILEFQEEGDYGESIKIRPLSYLEYSLTAITLFFVALLFVSFATYSRKQTVSGILVPKTGNIEIRSDKQGFVTELLAEEGDLVKEGQMIARIRSATNLSDGSRIQPALKHELLRQEALIVQEIDTLKNRSGRERQQLDNLRVAAQERLSLLDAQYELFNEQQSACDKITKSTQKLLKKGITTQRDYFNDVSRCLEIKEQIRANRLTYNESKAELEDTNFKLTFFNSTLQDSIAQLQKELSTHRRTMIESDAAYSSTILAPITGELLSLRILKGQNVAPGQLTAVMATEAYALEAHVYIPTRAIAFLAEGQNVRLRYDAFPYQRYGFSTGKVEKISKSIYSDASQGQDSEANSNLRFYRAVVRIDKQTIRIDDKPVRLQNGITVTADIFYDKRRIWQWILSPISNMSTGS